METSKSILCVSFLLSLACWQEGSAFEAPYESSMPQGEEQVIRLDGLQSDLSLFPSGPFSDTTHEPERGLRPPSDDSKRLLQSFTNNGKFIDNVYEIDREELSEGKVRQNGWSYHSFPTHQGGLARRYADPSFEELEKWPKRYQKYLNERPLDLIEKGEINKLSPIEKYEYLIGNTDFPLTKKEWEHGKETYESIGRVPKWYGACNGTAIASTSHERPTKSVKLMAHDGKNVITFYPSDIKALLSYAWSGRSHHVTSVGHRCRIATPRTANDIPSSCRDTNAGSFHLALTNVTGLHGRPINIDRSAWQQVWNRPIVSYEYEYKNLLTGRFTRKAKHALVLLKDHKNDPYKGSRAPETYSVLGVWARVTFLKDTEPNVNPMDSEQEDVLQTVHLFYDLELDYQGKIIGGMWHRNNFPDFIWRVKEGSRPMTIEDRVAPPLYEYKGAVPLPERIRDLAHLSAKRGLVMYRVLEAMVKLSNSTGPNS